MSLSLLCAEVFGKIGCNDAAKDRASVDRLEPKLWVQMLVRHVLQRGCAEDNAARCRVLATEALELAKQRGRDALPSCPRRDAHAAQLGVAHVPREAAVIGCAATASLDSDGADDLGADLVDGDPKQDPARTR